MTFQPWRYVPGKLLLVVMNIFSAFGLIFEGYNQGVYGSVSGTPGFIRMSGIGADGIVTNSTKQGGLAAAYYFGAVWGALVGGWLGDKLGRKRAVAIGAVLCLIGCALMAGSVNSNMFIIARIVTGLGIGFIQTSIPSWVAELSQAHNRGSNFSLVFVANFVGIVLAYWINFGIRGYSDEFRWRFPLGFMAAPMLIVLIAVPAIPESPRWLIANRRRDDAVYILCKLRGDISPDDPKLAFELEQLDAVVEESKHKRNNYINLFLGGRYSGALHLGRRAAMGAALQTIQQWTGILAIATWAGTVFSIAGFDSYKASWLAGLVNTFGIFGTAAAALVIDRLGRRVCLLVSFAIQGVALFLVGALIKKSQDYQTSNPELATTLGTAAGAFVFVYLWFFCMFNIVPSWLYGTEIWPQEVRAKGYSMTTLGWAIGCGVTGFVIPIMLSKLGYATFIFFGCMNIVAFPIIYLLYPETANRSLEEINLLFTSKSPLVKKNMQAYAARLEAAGGDLALAERKLMDEVNGIEMAADLSSETSEIDEKGFDAAKVEYKIGS